MWQGRVTVFHVEDDSIDQDLTKRLIDKLDFAIDYQLFPDSFSFNAKLDEEHSPPRRLLIILDISLPGITGKELLIKIRDDARYSRAAVVMLSGSNSERDLEFCLQNGCNGFIIKEARWVDFEPKCKRVLEAWLSLLGQVFI